MPIKLEPIKLEPIKSDKYPKVKPINIVIKKETYLDNYYSKDFLKQYFI